MPKRQRGTTRKQRRGRRQQRGGDSASYTFGPAVAAGAPYASEVVAKSACLAETRPGYLSNYSPPGQGGLPGFAGGGRRRTRRGPLNLRRLSRKVGSFFRSLGLRGKRGGQRGGRYMIDPAGTPTGPNVFAPVQRLGCEGGSVNTLPAGAVPGQKGGAGGLGVDKLAYYAPTAGYSNEPSKWVSSTGTPSLLQIPYEARAMNPACLKTGGRRRGRRAAGASRKTRRGRGGRSRRN